MMEDVLGDLEPEGSDLAIVHLEVGEEAGTNEVFLVIPLY